MNCVYAITPTAEHVGVIAVMFRHMNAERLRWGKPKIDLVTSLQPPGAEVIESVVTPEAMERINKAASFAHLSRSLAPWPTSYGEVKEALALAPRTVGEWIIHNLLWQSVCNGFIYPVNETTMGSQDMTLHLMAARLLGQTTVAILPTDTRELVASTHLTMTDFCVGDVDERVLSLVLGILTEDHP